MLQIIEQPSANIHFELSNDNIRISRCVFIEVSCVIGVKYFPNPAQKVAQ